MASSYQERKQEIVYLNQCIKELEERCKSLVKSKGEILLCGTGITGDSFITPYNNGEFDMELTCND